MKAKVLLIALSDALIFWASLVLMTFLRYGELDREIVEPHLLPFAFGLILWLTLFYIAGLYDLRFFRNSQQFNERYFGTIALSTVVLIVLFYLVPGFGIAPKRNLLLFAALFTILDFGWRRISNTFLGILKPTVILVIGQSASAKEAVDHLREHPQLGYEVKDWIEDETHPLLAAETLPQDIEMIVLTNAAALKLTNHPALHRAAAEGVRIASVQELYEAIFKKTPLEEFDEVGLLEILSQRHSSYQPLRRSVELFFAILLLIIFLPLMILIGLLVQLTSKGPAFYAQRRVGLRGRVFTFYKFRSMHNDASRNPDAHASGTPTWAQGGSDPRLTSFGKLIRSTHLDELPQLFNVIRGDMSFIGPRPERPEFVEKLREAIPFYGLRHLIKPGITGWAQANYGYAASVEQSREKLQFELFYLKYRSFVLDVQIILKTIARLFV